MSIPAYQEQSSYQADQRHEQTQQALPITNQQNYQLQSPYNQGQNQDLQQQSLQLQESRQAENYFIQEGSYKSLRSCELNERKGFITKVYSILSIQLAATFLMATAAYFSISWRNLLANPQTGNLTVFSWLGFVFMFITEIAIFVLPVLWKKVPHNYIALSIFTLCFSVFVSGTCGIVYNSYDEGGIMVLSAALLTFAVTFSLTLYACTTKSDFTTLGGGLWVCITVMLIVSIISIIDPSLYILYIVSGIITICYGFYLIYDTQLIMGGKQYELSIDDYIIGAMLIYIDIIVLFLRILEILILAKKK